MTAAVDAPVAATGLTRRHGILALAVLLSLIAGALVTGAFADTGMVGTFGGPWVLTVASYPVAAGLLVFVRPDLRYSWTIMGLTLAMMASMLCYALAAVLQPDPAAWANAVGDMLNTVSVVLAIGLLPLLFPDGRLPSPRWRPAVWLITAGAAAGGAAALLTGGWGGDPDQTLYPSPLAKDLGHVGTALTRVFYPLLMAMLVTSAASVVARYRQSEGIERKQLQWLTVAASYSLAVVLGSLTIGSVNKNTGGLDALLTSLGFALIPAAICIAVLRYRLYDVDIVINRSLFVAGLALFILVVYVTVVVGVGTLLRGSGQSNLALQIGATALVAVGFQPWRRRMRRWADRVVYGHRASPYEVLGSFAQIAARTPDEDTRQRIADLLASGTGAAPATVWLRVGEQLRPVAASPLPTPLPDPVAIRDDRLPGELPGDLAVPVEHEGQLLGALAITKPRGEVVTDQDGDVTRRLATGIALTLRTERLTAELAARLEDLHTSRSRILHAQDEARRRLERDLHETTQHQLSALTSKLAQARALAADTDATTTTGLLDQIATDAADAVDSLTELARGIYPPLLEADGLHAALTVQTSKAALPVHVTGTARRHDRDVELAAYFCMLEALQNIAKYARASHATVHLEDHLDHLTFTVTDDGTGFDPATTTEGTGIQGMRDRLDTLDGRLTITSSPGVGTTCTGTIPTRARVRHE